ncbi:MAG: hypothetical protein HYZ42_07425 [Bacteroidetes bacterium]|nr:hypothetical protein [Bacteroidota bacterium]
MKNLYLFIILISVMTSCDKKHASLRESKGLTPSASATKTLYGPIAEKKIYKLLNGYSSSDDFEASGVYAMGSYFYMVFDNRYKIGKLLNTLPENSGSNSLLSSGSGSSNFEGIAYDNVGTPNWYVVEESVSNGGSYYPRIREYDNSMNYQSNQWTDYSFNSSNNNKEFEGIAYIRRNNEDYLLSIVEGTGNIAVMKQSGSSWTTITEFNIPVTFTDYSDIAIYGNKLAVTSQEDAQLWVGTLSSTSWATTGGSGTVYDFPKGSSTGVVGTGNYTLYGNVEGVSFINDSTIVTCTDKASNSQPSYQTYKDQSVQIFKLR